VFDGCWADRSLQPGRNLQDAAGYPAIHYKILLQGSVAFDILRGAVDPARSSTHCLSRPRPRVVKEKSSLVTRCKKYFLRSVKLMPTALRSVANKTDEILRVVILSSI
jgi:hypothetical protein